MVKKQIKFGEFEVPIPKGYKQIVDKDSTTDYLFVNAPRGIYTIYFDSSMPIYGQSILDGAEEGSSLELKMQDRKICFFCPTRTKGRKDALWYFNLEFKSSEDELLILPGQVLVNSDEVYRKTVGGKLPFVEILEQIKLKKDENNKIII